MRVLFYGRLAEAIGSELQVDAAPSSSIAELRDRLADAHPEADQMLRSRQARAFVGGCLVNDDYQVRPTDAVEFLPPVSGG